MTECAAPGADVQYLHPGARRDVIPDHLQRPLVQSPRRQRFGAGANVIVHSECCSMVQYTDARAGR